jgi:hypothetical protein
MLDRISRGQHLLELWPPQNPLDRRIDRRQLHNGHKRHQKLSILTARFRNALKKSVEGIVEAGRVLIEAKSELSMANLSTGW